MDWQLLLQIDTDERIGMHWGDAGMIYKIQPAGTSFRAYLADPTVRLSEPGLPQKMVLPYTNARVKLPDMAEVPFVGAPGGVISHRSKGGLL